MSDDPLKASEGDGGLIARVAKNRVLANLIMLVLIVGGLLMAGRIKQEVFPEVTLDQVIITVTYPGASPEEVEEGIVLSIEEAVRGIDGVKDIRSAAAEGVAQVVVELRSGTDQNRALSDVKSEVDAIQSFPEDAERPIVSVATNRREVVSLILYGDVDASVLHNAAERARRGLLEDPRITQVEITGLPPPEISIEVSEESQRRHGLTLPEIARRVAEGSADVPGGGVDTDSGEVLVRTEEKKERVAGFEAIALIAGENGSRVTVGDLAKVVDGFREVDREAFYDGKPAARVRVFRVADQTPLEVAAAVHDYLEEAERTLGDQVSVAVYNDRSVIYNDRVALLLKNALLGAGLVILILGLFLDPRLAFWVTIGIPVSFLGAFLVMPILGVSINMISLFAFILTLGIVVDDAIVVGEAVYRQRQEGRTAMRAAIEGAREVRSPIIFAVVTTITAFVPLLFVPGVTGKFFDNIPLVVIPILALSLIESFFVLPAHLGHEGWGAKSTGAIGFLRRHQSRFSAAVERFAEGPFARFSAGAVKHRFITLALAFGVLLIAGGLVAGGRVKFTFFPKIEGETITASLRMPYGAPMEKTREAVERLTESFEKVGGRFAVGVYAEIGVPGATSSEVIDPTDTGSHLAYVQVELTPAAEREVRAKELSDRWRREIGEIAGVESLELDYGVGPPTGKAVAIELSSESRETLERAAGELADQLRGYGGVIEVDDGFKRGKPQIDLTLRPSARALGIREAELGAQVRAAFFGAEALRQQRGRHELRVYVRRPEHERVSVQDIESLVVLTPEGGAIPLDQAAYVSWDRSPTAIERENGKRVVVVTGEVEGGVTGGEVTEALSATALPELTRRHPDLDWGLAGEQEEQAETLGALKSNMLIALIVMFALMAAAFRSYVQPIVVMMAIPFGFVGALMGHLLLGFELSIISVFGIVALSGVVVNDSLVLISAVNEYREQGMSAQQALVAGTKRRFRPIVLTSLTTFAGLAPMIFETSIQARFLIPMALSLASGVLFVTVIALFIVPALYMVLEDIRRLGSKIERRAHSAVRGREEPARS